MHITPYLEVAKEAFTLSYHKFCHINYSSAALTFGIDVFAHIYTFIECVLNFLVNLGWWQNLKILWITFIHLNLCQQKKLLIGRSTHHIKFHLHTHMKHAAIYMLKPAIDNIISKF